jgi:RHS repeat-associated protein
LIYQDITYTLDAVGNVEEYTNDAYDYWTNQTYKYDDLYQLVRAEGDSRGTGNAYSSLPHLYVNTYTQEFMFDSIGNMTKKVSRSSSPGDDLTYQFDYDYLPGTHKASRIGSWYYHYDGNGNLLTENYGSPVTVNANNAQVTMENDVYSTDYAFAYTERGGNSVGSGGERRDYQWNERNLLRRSVNRRYQTDYRYGADGERALKHSVAGTQRTETRYYNKMFQVSMVQSYTTESKHIYVGEVRIVTKQKDEGNPQTQQEKQQQYYYHGDHLGSAQLVTNWRGEMYEHLEYTPYGELWVDHATSEVGLNPTLFRFTGKEMDVETGLYYYGARYLDPKTSRWISADPAMGEYIPHAPINDDAKKHNGNLPGMGGVFNLVNMHVYHYAGNNPVVLTDPDGETTIVNNSKNWIIIRGEDGETHAVKPGETYNTKEHSLKDIDGILMHDGSTYKVNNGNKDATFTISESTEGGYRVVPDGEGYMVNIKGDRIKNIRNHPLVSWFFKGKKLEKSGNYKKDDGSTVGGSWWTKAMRATGLNDEDINNAPSWNSKLAEFRKKNPDGIND